MEYLPGLRLCISVATFKEDAVAHYAGWQHPWSKGYAAVEPERGEVNEFDRKRAIYVCPKGHEFELTFAYDAELPETWDCRRHGTAAKAQAGTVTVPPIGKKTSPPLTHWEYLLMRRSIPELEDILDEALALLAKKRREEPVGASVVQEKT